MFLPSTLYMQKKKKNQCLLVIDVVVICLSPPFFNGLRGTPARISHASRSRQSYDPLPPPDPLPPVRPSSLAFRRYYCIYYTFMAGEGGRALCYSASSPPVKMMFYKIKSAFSYRRQILFFFLRFSKMYFICVRLDFCGGGALQTVKANRW